MFGFRNFIIATYYKFFYKVLCLCKVQYDTVRYGTLVRKLCAKDKRLCLRYLIILCFNLKKNCGCSYCANFCWVYLLIRNVLVWISIYKGSIDDTININQLSVYYLLKSNGFCRVEIDRWKYWHPCILPVRYILTSSGIKILKSIFERIAVRYSTAN